METVTERAPKCFFFVGQHTLDLPLALDPQGTAMQAFEDAGYFCVDNLPPEMIGGLVELFTHGGSKVQRAAVVCDMRGGELFEGLNAVLDDLDARGVEHRLLFLTASEGAHPPLHQFRAP